MQNIQQRVEELKNSGYSFFNTNNKDKKVTTSWTRFQTEKPTDKDIEQFLKMTPQNYAIVCGEISDLVVIDVDTKNDGDPTPFQDQGFYEVRTPSGGYHFYFKYDSLLKSTKHAQTGFLKGIDIQSNSSLIFCVPTDFGDKGTYTIVNDAPIKAMPDDLLATVVGHLEPEKEAVEYTPFKAIKNPEMGRPGDIFNALATWEQILIPAGWDRVGNNSNGVQFWRRPGKKDGLSASTNWKGYDLFFPYTTSVDNLEPKKGYTKFSLYAHLNHDGDFREAAKSLVMENYKLANKLI